MDNYLFLTNWKPFSLKRPKRKVPHQLKLVWYEISKTCSSLCSKEVTNQSYCVETNQSTGHRRFWNFFLSKTLPKLSSQQTGWSCSVLVKVVQGELVFLMLQPRTKSALNFRKHQQGATATTYSPYSPLDVMF